MNRRFRASVVGAIVSATIIAVSAQTTPKTIHLIGCVQKNGGAYILKDTRAPDDSYRLDGTAEDLEFHAGHFVEVVGSITDAATNPVRFKVASVIYLSQTCPPGAKK
jgi:hypothetical protein